VVSPAFCEDPRGEGLPNGGGTASTRCLVENITMNVQQQWTHQLIDIEDLSELESGMPDDSHVLLIFYSMFNQILP